MKLKHYLILALATIAATGISQATTFFSDNFTNGSTLNSLTPANPTPTNTAYELVASKTWSPAPTLTARDLKFGIAATSSGYIQAQALFSTNAVALTQPGDYIQLTVVFTNTTGLLTVAGQLGFGLYNSGQVKPVAGGINNSLPASFTGAAQNWQGYVGLINQGASTSRILSRPTQSGATLASQDLVTIGTSSSMASSVIGTAVALGQTLATNAPYTAVLIITMVDANNLSISNTLYAGPNTGGTLLTNFGSVATAPFTAAGFDALAIGYCGRNTGGGAPLLDISSIDVSGSVTVVSGPPTIDQQPVAVTVATNSSCLFSVTATGFNMTYQWRRNGTNLLNGGNISGATSSTLIINNANVADAATGASGYYVAITGAGNYTTNSTTNSLTLVPRKNLVWTGANSGVWDFLASTNWNDPVNPAGFSYGDSVTFNDLGAASPSVTLTGNFLSASSWTISEATAYAFSGTGSFAGPGSLIFNSAASGNIQLDLNNTHTGGTIVSNSNPELLLYLSKYQVLGNGPLTYAKPGKMQITVTGSATVGIPGDVTVNDDFTNRFDGTGTFAGIFLGNISGTVGKTLTLTPGTPAAINRYRVYGTNLTCNANLNLEGITTDQAQYNGTVLAPYNSTGVQTYNGVISGDGGLIQRGTGITLLNAANTFAGGTTPTAGAIGLGHNNALGTGPLNLAAETPNTLGSGTIYAAGGARTIANTVQYPSGTNNQTLIIVGTNDLTFTSAINLNGVDGVGTSNRTFTVNNTAATTLSGIISDNGNNIGLVKNGTNTLYLNGVNTYSGPTTVSAGRLAGSGTIAGSVLVTTNSAISGGTAGSIGTLNITGNLIMTNGGGGFFRLNRAGLSSDKAAVTGGLTNYGVGVISVTNLGAALQVGDTFAVFNKAVVGGATMTISGGGNVTWTNKLALNGTIEVLPSVNTNPTNIVASVSGNVLTLSWPASHTGWRLQVQTNALANGLNPSSNAWTAVAGSASVNTTNLTINPASGTVFYRLVYP